jgi:hypothetical protein
MSGIEAVHVHLASSDVPVGQAPAHRKIVTVFRTIVLTADNPYEQAVNENPSRYCWTMTGGQASATLAANDLAVGTNQGDIQQLAGKAEALVVPGMFVPAQTLGYKEQIFFGVNPVWIVALGASPTYPMYIGIADHVYADG